MNMKYITKVKANLSIYTRKKTSNLLDGVYNSIYKGKSMNFQDLREYVVGDNIKDIDWKASARSDKILIKQYIAEKKHNILFIFDSGKRMLADSKDLEPKKDIAIITAGTIGYLIDKNGDSVGAICNGKDGINYFQFNTGLNNIEKILTYYEKDIASEGNLNKLVEYVYKHIKRRMIVFIITDIDGINNISEETYKKLTAMHDVMIVNVSDASISEENSFDVDQDSYIPFYMWDDEKLRDIELQIKNEMYKEIENKLRKYKIAMTTIDNQKNIVNDIFKLLERRKNANFY
ncbi:MAG: DUF58 domain-containing protein [Clostridia bacterium]|nr:DUF58 domain-containing protein [Clostridia bacterium]